MQDDVTAVRRLERSRLQALVAGDWDTAARLHAEDFQLVTPSGQTLDKAAYLAAVASGDIRYWRWDPQGEIAVRAYGPAVVLRYQAELEMGDETRRTVLHCWHLDVYEQREGGWQVVWSQATQIRA